MVDGVFEKYELVRRLSMGGMGEILLARQKGVAGTERTVIIKMILPHLAQDPEFIGRFTDETRIAASLSHGNIVQIFESGCWEGRFFMVMEYVDGLDLKELLGLTGAGKRLENWVPFCIHVLSETAKALAYAHDKRDPSGRPLGIVHRDVSPSNILISREGLVKLTDFGVAKAAQRTSVTMPGKLHGKVNYMAPEQVRGMECDHRSDIFSLGVTGYEMLAGIRPFQGDSDVAVLEKIRNMDFVPLHLAAPSIPAELAAIIARAMDRDPDARWQSAEEFSARLLAFAHDQGMKMLSRDLAQMLAPLFSESPAVVGTGVSIDEYLEDAIAGLMRTPSAGSLLAGDGMTPVATSRERTVTISEPPTEQRPQRPRRHRLTATIVAFAVVLAAAASITVYRVIESDGVFEDRPGALSAQVKDNIPTPATAPGTGQQNTNSGNQTASAGTPSRIGVPTSDLPGPARAQVAPVPNQPPSNQPPPVNTQNQPVPAPLDARRTISLQSDPPGADVLESGKLLGTTPLRLAADRETTVTLRMDGFGDVIRKVGPDSPASLKVRMPAPDGRVVFRFFPADSNVLVDGNAIKTDGNLVEMALTPGTHTLTVASNKGDTKKTRSFTIDPGKTLALGTIELDADPGR